MNYIFVDFEVKKNSRRVVKNMEVQMVEKIKVDMLVLDELNSFDKENYIEMRPSRDIIAQLAKLNVMTMESLIRGEFLQGEIESYVNWCLGMSKEITAIGLEGKIREYAMDEVRLGRITCTYEVNECKDEYDLPVNLEDEGEEKFSLALVEERMPEQLQIDLCRARIQPLFKKDYRIEREYDLGMSRTSLTNKVRAVNVNLAR
ncbi:MAG: hypothetical protein MJ172_09970 [Clostridia bacterium]|nr:hypothetical protein [Clostridia bacterium]